MEWCGGSGKTWVIMSFVTLAFTLELQLVHVPFSFVALARAWDILR